ncbi:MAG: hypothetical protein ACI9RM_001294 [Ulvibacter sp.]|jgi:hypothetical protein
MRNTNRLKIIIFTSIYICILGTIVAQGPLAPKVVAQNSIFSNFYNEDCLEITLESDFDKLIENKKTITYQDAWISYKANDGKKIKQLIQIRPRGKSRRIICDIPPVMMNFARGNPEAIKIKEDQKLKLVTHCYQRRSAKGQQNILKEFLTYKLLNMLTEKSFRVQLVRITYLNTRNHDSSQRFGFIIEGAEELANRLEATRTKERDIPVAQLDTDQYNTVAIFQYMISNTDWDFIKLHNVKIFTSESSKKNMIVPYDFDYAGLVHTDYARVNPNYDQKELSDRIFLGAFYEKAELNKTLDLFKSKKKEMLSYCEGLSYLTKKNRRYVRTHLKSFHKSIRKKRFVKREFLKSRPK